MTIAENATQRAIRDVSTAIQTYETAETVAFDLETSGLQPWAAKTMVVSLAAPGLPPAILHVHGVVPPELITLLSRKHLIGHNITTFDIPFLMNDGYDPLTSAGWSDTLVAEQLCLTSGRRDIKKNLQTVVLRRCGVALDKDVDHAGWSNPELSNDQLRYCVGDVAYIHKVFAVQQKYFETRKLADAWETECLTSRATAVMVHRGVPLLRDKLQEYIESSREECAKAAVELHAVLGPINCASPTQIRKAFQSVFGIDLPATDDETMAHLESLGDESGRIAGLVRTFRHLNKRDSYDEEWCEKFVAGDGRIRAGYWSLGTDTGRYSSTKPNFQQWPAAMRGLIGYPEDAGRMMVSVDYSQIEVLIAAVLFREMPLVKAVLEGDVHTTVASMLFNVPIEFVTSDQRRVAKAASFTLLFAGGYAGLVHSATAGGTVLSSEDGNRIMAQFYRSFPSAAAYISNARKQVQRCTAQGTAYVLRIPKGPVRSLFNEKLTPSTLINTLIQGTAAVGLKRALGEVVQRGMGQYLVATVHDEGVLDTPESVAREVAEEVRECMLGAMERLLGVRPSAKIVIGRTWGG